MLITLFFIILLLLLYIFNSNNNTCNNNTDNNLNTLPSKNCRNSLVYLFIFIYLFIYLFLFIYFFFFFIYLLHGVLLSRSKWKFLSYSDVKPVCRYYSCTKSFILFYSKTNPNINIFPHKNL